MAAVATSTGTPRPSWHISQAAGPDRERPIYVLLLNGSMPRKAS
jgi:hypothetical protein